MPATASMACAKSGEMFALLTDTLHTLALPEADHVAEPCASEAHGDLTCLDNLHAPDGDEKFALSGACCKKTTRLASCAKSLSRQTFPDRI